MPHITKLVCRNFRSYKTLALNISSGFVVFFGDNGAGKTNILEAISLFSPDRGLRKAAIADLSSFGSIPFSWSIEAVVSRNGLKTFLSTNVQNGRRVAKIDDSQVATLSKFADIIWVLWVVPSMDNIFIDSSSIRRSFFDHLVGGYEKKHKFNLKKLADLQKERLHVICHRKDDRWMQVLEEKIAEKNIEIAKSRLEFIELLHITFESHPSKFLRPTVEIFGEVENIFLTHSEEDAVLEIVMMLKNSRHEDSESQTTAVSTQKSLWKVKHKSTNLEAENCSTGEQKAFLISLVLAAVRIYRKMRAGIPILLLDDLMVHLDKYRRADLLEELKTIGAQTFFTGTDLSFFENIIDVAQIYHVKNSICSLENPTADRSLDID